MRNVKFTAMTKEELSKKALKFFYEKRFNSGNNWPEPDLSGRITLKDAIDFAVDFSESKPPTDKEIEKEAQIFSDSSTSDLNLFLGFVTGAKWFKEKMNP